MLDVGLDLRIGETVTEESFDVEDSVTRVQAGLCFGGIADEAIRVGEGDVRGRAWVTLVVGYDFDATFVPHGHSAIY